MQRWLLGLHGFVVAFTFMGGLSVYIAPELRSFSSAAIKYFFDPDPNACYAELHDRYVYFLSLKSSYSTGTELTNEKTRAMLDSLFECGESGSYRAFERLGKIYFENVFVKRDCQQVVRYYELAEAAGSKDATLWLRRNEEIGIC